MPARSRSSSSSRSSRRAADERALERARAARAALAAEGVEDLELGRGEHQLAVLVLAVEGEQRDAERAQLGGRHRAPLEVGARAARRGHAAGEHELVAVERQALGELGELRIALRARRAREHALDVGLVGARAGRSAARLAAQQQVERVGEHRLARAGLAGDHVQPAVEQRARRARSAAGSGRAARAARRASLADGAPTEQRLKRDADALLQVSWISFSRKRR